MSFFKAIIIAGITRAELTTVSEENFISVEKRLLAVHRINNSISKYDVAIIMRVIRHYPDVMSVICRLDCFYGLLTGNETNEIGKKKIDGDAILARIRHVVSYYFYDEVVAYVKQNAAKNNWNNLRVLIYYKAFFTPNIIFLLTRKLESKLSSFLTVLSQLRPHAELNKKIGFFNDSDFFILLSEVAPGHFDKYLFRLVFFLKDNFSYTRQIPGIENLLTNIFQYETQNAYLKDSIYFIHVKLPVDERKEKIRANIILFVFITACIIFIAYVESVWTH